MPNLNDLLTSENTIEYVFEHNLLLKKNFSNTKIYTANGDLKKRWYVYFSFRNPKSRKLQRMKNIYGKTNNYKTKEDRMFVLSTYHKKLLQPLEQGYNPFDQNTDLFEKRTKKHTLVPVVKNNTGVQKIDPKNNNTGPVIKKIDTQEQNGINTPTLSIRESFEFGL